MHSPRWSLSARVVPRPIRSGSQDGKPPPLRSPLRVLSSQRAIKPSATASSGLVRLRPTASSKFNRHR